MKKQDVVARVSYKNGTKRGLKVVEGDGVMITALQADGSATYTAVGRVNEVLGLDAAISMCKERSYHMNNEHEYSLLINEVEDTLLAGLRWIQDIPREVQPDEATARALTVLSPFDDELEPEELLPFEPVEADEDDTVD